MRTPQAGFTLIEMMVALVVGALSVIVAAKVAQVVIRQAAQGQQATDFNARSRLIGRQLRADLRAAGYGSTGAVAVDNTVAPWNSGMAVLVDGKPTLPAIGGANNLPGAAFGGVAIQPNSDAMMIIVPNAGLSGVTTGWNAAGGNAISLGPPPSNPTPTVQPLTNCTTGMVYAVDHTAPNGAGRAQLINLLNVAGDTVNLADTLQFTLAPGSTVSCARLSTYWVDTNGWLHRTDFGPAANPVQMGGVVFVDTNAIGNDLVAPGVIDLQIAYRFSAEIYVNANLVPPAANDLPAQWAYEGLGGNVDAMVTGNPTDWFEVRRVRINALMRTVRRVDARPSGQKSRLPREDGPPVLVDQPHRAEWVTTVETLTNLRYFDHGAPSGVIASPF